MQINRLAHLSRPILLMSEKGLAPSKTHKGSHLVPQDTTWSGARGLGGGVSKRKVHVLATLPVEATYELKPFPPVKQAKRLENRV